MSEIRGRGSAGCLVVLGRYFRVATPALLVLLQSALFLAIFCQAIGGTTAPILPHLVLCLTWIACMYGAAALALMLPPQWIRGFALWTVGLATVLVTTVFYLVAGICLYGFRDLPTRGIVKGYLPQVPSMITTLPFDRSILLFGGGILLGVLLAVSLCVAWGLAGIESRLPAVDKRNETRMALILAPTILICLVRILPAGLFLARLEPWTRSALDRPLATSNLNLQANPVEVARDLRVEAEYPKKPMGRRLNVILIYIDGLRADVLEPYGGKFANMPFMTRLVQEGKVLQFPRVFATCSMTLGGLGSILQSRPSHRISPQGLSLPKILHRQGYETRYLLSGDHQHFLSLKQYYEPYDFYMDGVDLDATRSTDDLFIFGELDRLPTVQATTKPQFIMLGLMSAHVWGRRHPEFRRWLPDKLTSTSFHNLNANSVDAYRNNYMNGTLQADSVLSLIWRWLEESGYLDNSIIIITSDHGESLGENGKLGHAQSLSTAELLIPLWIHDPTGQIQIRDLVFQEDLAPTVLDLLELPRPETWVGSSLVNPPPSERANPLYFINSRDKFGLIVQRNGRTLKYLFDKGQGIEQVFDMDVDLLETNDLSKTMAEETMNEFRKSLRSSFGPLLPPP